MQDLELWGGPECTLNRLAKGYRDQFAALGHYDRPGDVDLFAGLGISAIRYPILWERVAPDAPDRRDWQWADRQLTRLRRANLRVIAGLVHHGGGPRYTDLLDPGFATGLAAFAGKVAARYDWITDWTPVNEPLTTARFSALYGHWYPHHRSEESFWLALVNQIDGVRLAMDAVRRINPEARLIQTDDLGRTYATATMREQAAFDNVRRWMSWDLLCGKVVPGHPFWDRLVGFGLGDRLRQIADAPSPPDVLGLNHYLTSDRFLDHRIDRYPERTHGDNGRRRFADVEALRALQPAPPGLAGVVREAWERYRLPIAITEVHNGCTREEQLRWMAQAWDTALALRREGVAVEAVTAWSLLGSAGWNTLLRDTGVYEPGVFDVSTGTPRPTALAPLLRGLRDGAPRHPVAAGAGWWQRPIRLLHPTVPRPAPVREHAGIARGEDAWGQRPLLIWGDGGVLARAVAGACAHRDIPHVLLPADPDAIARALDRHAPWAVVDAAEPPGSESTRALAHACAERGVASVHCLMGAPDGDADRAATDRDLASRPGSHLIIRAGPDAPPHDTPAMRVLVDRLLDLLIDGATGSWHVTDDRAVPCSDGPRSAAVSTEVLAPT